MSIDVDEKASRPIEVIDSGSVIDVSAHAANAKFSMVSNVLGKSIEVRLMQNIKAEFGIVVRDAGSVTELRE